METHEPWEISIKSGSTPAVDRPAFTSGTDTSLVKLAIQNSKQISVNNTIISTVKMIPYVINWKSVETVQYLHSLLIYFLSKSCSCNPAGIEMSNAMNMRILQIRGFYNISFGSSVLTYYQCVSMMKYVTVSSEEKPTANVFDSIIFHNNPV